MHAVIDEHFGGGSIEDFLRRVNIEPEFTFESEDAVLQYSVDGLNAAKAAMPRVFNRLPEADVIIKPYPEFAESGIGEYHSPIRRRHAAGHFLYCRYESAQQRSRVTQRSTLLSRDLPGPSPAECDLIGVG